MRENDVRSISAHRSRRDNAFAMLRIAVALRVSNEKYSGLDQFEIRGRSPQMRRNEWGEFAGFAGRIGNVDRRKRSRLLIPKLRVIEDDGRGVIAFASRHCRAVVVGRLGRTLATALTAGRRSAATAALRRAVCTVDRQVDGKHQRLPADPCDDHNARHSGLNPSTRGVAQQAKCLAVESRAIDWGKRRG